MSTKFNKTNNKGDPDQVHVTLGELFLTLVSRDDLKIIFNRIRSKVYLGIGKASDKFLTCGTLLSKLT